MPRMFLFEFMDQARIFPPVRATLRKIFERGNARPFRP
jgi:hypothetical protein